MKFSLKGEPESRSTDDYWRFWDTVYLRWREPVPVIKMQKKNANLSGQQSFSKCQFPVLHFLFSVSSYEENDVRESALYDQKDEKNLA
ncbi:hypothetical protein F2Q69_00037666 [Brassica cretica]|uniref:Uncharacterized protein n=2 Tax=Brassica TaxID=3705 RepID=A0A8S9SB41_BRACR|nr:hypothetical protein F2Q69_00037666 [Brassica cretica]